MTSYAVYNDSRLRILKRNFRPASQQEFEYFEDTSVLSIASWSYEPTFDIDFDGSSDIWNDSGRSSCDVRETSENYSV